MSSLYNGISKYYVQIKYSKNILRHWKFDLSNLYLLPLRPVEVAVN